MPSACSTSTTFCSIFFFLLCREVQASRRLEVTTFRASMRWCPQRPVSKLRLPEADSHPDFSMFFGANRVGLRLDLRGDHQRALSTAMAHSPRRQCDDHPSFSAHAFCGRRRHKLPARSRERGLQDGIDRTCTLRRCQNVVRLPLSFDVSPSGYAEVFSEPFTLSSRTSTQTGNFRRKLVAGVRRGPLRVEHVFRWRQ